MAHTVWYRVTGTSEWLLFTSMPTQALAEQVKESLVGEFAYQGIKITAEVR